MRVRFPLLGLSLALGLSVVGCGNAGTGQGPDSADLGGGAADLGCGSACPCTCPGQGLTTTDVVCGQDMGPTCQLTCRGENYDVDGDPKNGCEMAHAVTPGHNQVDSDDRGHKSCFDTSTDAFFTFLLSDSRVHQNPLVGSFNVQVGSAPDFYRVEADGGAFCVNDYDVTFSTSGGGTDKCYQCTIITDKMTQSVMATGSELVKMSSGSGSYSNNSVVYFKIEKICSLPRQEAVKYQVIYHL
jgi:hypothetical protein